MSLLITLEGIDGSGKTTLINNLKKSGKLDLVTYNWRDTDEKEILEEVQTVIEKLLPKKLEINNLPSGKIEPDETPLEAAKREVFEETNLVVGDLEKITEKTVFFANLPKEIQHWEEEMYSSFLRWKLNEKYLKSNFSQTQKAKFVVGNYENDAIVVGAKASQIFNRSLTALILFRLAYRYRKQRLNFIQKENKRFEEIKNNIEYIKIKGAEKKEIKKSRQFLKNNWRNILSLSFTKSLYASITNYVLLEFLPIFFLIFFVGGQGVGFSVALYISLKELFGAWKKIVEMFWAHGGYDVYLSSLKQLNNAFAILEKDAEVNKLSNQLVLSLEEAEVKKIIYNKKYNGWTFPGGKLEFNETPLKAAEREVFEETNLLVQNLKQIGKRKLQAKEKEKGSVIETKFFSEEEIAKIKLSGATKYFFEQQVSNFPKNKTITFQNVNFAYPETNKKILDNFSFTFQSGKKYAIVGPNGIGKSTLFKLLAKLYKPSKGAIKIDNVDLEKFDSSALRPKIAYLPNNPSFFNTSLGNNIVYPNIYQESIHKEKLEKLAKNLGIKEFVDKLPSR
ncbi:1072_t:CDS:2 [Ambispora leptoticha]|uniref:1072_t:CDS:1 n=1 Tax=Ambispora leptoticha TaxID=144679 RepID=A0A9N8VXS5_9GLOM|nr:1072_t:CDS:2 [Ambispora leptoticha]